MRNIEQLTNNCIAWIKDWFDENGKGCNAIIGISGGKDSTVVAALCVKALGADRVLGVLMPCGIQKDIEDSYKVCQHLGIQHVLANIEPAVESVLQEVHFAGVNASSQTRTNLPARIRMCTLYAFSQSLNGRVANTCNRSEDMVGYFTKFGDGAGDFAPLAMLTVSEVVAIGDFLGLPYDLVHKTPIDGLNTNSDGSYVIDEQSLGFSYTDVDKYLAGEELPEATYNAIDEKVCKSAFKLEPMSKFEP